VTASPTPEISVVMTFHNAALTLDEAIQSVLGQEAVDFELLLVDDGSSDSSVEVTRRYTDPRLRLLQPGRVGRATALNLGLAKARAGLVAILDADDRAAPFRLRDQVAFLRQHPEVTLVAGNAALINRGGERLGQTDIGCSHERLVATLFALNPFAHSTVAYRRANALAVGGYNTRCEKSIDFNFYLALLADGARFGGMPQQIIELRYYPETWGRRDDSALQMRFGILGLANFRSRQLGRDPLLSLPDSQWLALRKQFDAWFEGRGFLARHQARAPLHQAAAAWRDGDYRKVVMYAAAALRLDPFAPLRRGIGFRYPKHVDAFLVSIEQA
jgi:glycosyltransferase involved in cell wall biosynthesis